MKTEKGDRAPLCGSLGGVGVGGQAAAIASVGRGGGTFCVAARPDLGQERLWPGM